MSKKTAIIIVLALALILIGSFLIFYFFFYAQAPTEEEMIVESESGFPGARPISKPPRPTGTGGQGSEGAEETGGSYFSTEKTLQQLTFTPTSGAVSIATTTANILRYVERSNGHVYELRMDNGGKLSRASNKTIPKIEEAMFKKTGNELLLRYLKDESDRIETFSAKIAPKASNPEEGDLEGTFLPPNIRVLALSPNTEKIFYLSPEKLGSRAIVSDFAGKDKLQVASLPFKELIALWPREKIVTLTTKAASGAPGNLFELNIATGAFDTVLSNIPGLTALESPDGANILYSTSNERNLELKLLNVKEKKTMDIGIATLPEKCVWSAENSKAIYCAAPTFLPAGYYPDRWYQGFVLFSDDIWKIDAETGNAILLNGLMTSAGRDIDATGLFLNEKENYLFFINKRDLTLWALKI